MQFKQKMQQVTFLVIAAFFWGTTFVAQRIAGQSQGAFTFCCIRNVMAVILLTPVIQILERKYPAWQDRDHKENAAIRKGGFVTGIFLALTAIFQQIGITMGTSAGKAGFLTSCYIVLVPVLGIFFRKKCKSSIWISIVLAVLGLYLLCVTDGVSYEQSDIYVLICSLACAFQIISVDTYAPQIKNPVRLAQMEFGVCAAICALPMFWVEMQHSMAGVQLWLQSLADIRAWIPILYAGIFSSGVAYTLQIFGQKDLNPTIASLVMSLESVFSVLAGALILQEVMSGKEIAGCIILLIAVILAQI